VAATDVNGDGFEDLVIGNIGENFYLKPDSSHPVKLWVNDFDGNGSIDQFLTRTIDGKDVPVFLKREITEQFPGLKKDNLRHSDYAKKTIEQLFPEGVVKNASQLLFNFCSSIVAINNGKGHFTVHSLPMMVQLSSVNAIASADINNDGYNDLVMGGNMYGFPPQFGRLDASYGHVLLNDGKGNFTWVDPKQSGVNIKGEIKDIRFIRTKNKNCLLITRNNDTPVLLALKNQKL
jgi:hypothetical protein